MSTQYDHLIHIHSPEEFALYELIPDVVWVFDLDKHGWWWGNPAAIKFWGLDSLDDLVNKDLSGDTQGARERTAQTFELASKNGLTVDPWTTYPNGKPKTLFMRHRACLLGPERHRGIIAFINEEVNLGDTPENLLLVEAMRYTTVLVTSFTFDGRIVVENPSATEAYKHIDHQLIEGDLTPFSRRFVSPEEGAACLQRAIDQKGGRWTHEMKTDQGVRKHTLDIRMTRHPLSGDFLLLMTEYDVTDLHEALDTANQVQSKLRRMAHYDALTGLSSLHYLSESALSFFSGGEQQESRVAVLFIDLDGFKEVNDTWGHTVGDQVLVETAKRIAQGLRCSDHAARLGGDEFVIVLEAVQQRQNAIDVAQKLIELMKQPVTVECEENGLVTTAISASIGIAMSPDHGDSLEQLIKRADAAMYQAKRHGKDAYSMAE